MLKYDVRKIYENVTWYSFTRVKLTRWNGYFKKLVEKWVIINTCNGTDVVFNHRWKIDAIIKFQ